MKKIISIILFCSFLLICFSGCSISNVDDVNGTTSGEDGTTTGEDGTTSNNEINSTPEDKELSEMFGVLEDDSDSNDKIYFYTGQEELHNELKNSGLYENSRWQPSGFEISIKCDFEKAANEDWYKQCPNTDTKSLNEAFYNNIAHSLLKGTFSNIVFMPGVRLSYSSANDLYADYSTIKSLTSLEYVTIIEIGYLYGLPYDYIME